MKFRVLQAIRVGSEIHPFGAIIDATDDRDWEQIERLGLVEKVDDNSAVFEHFSQKGLQTVIIPDDTKRATIKRGGPWYKVFNEKGEQLGKPTRDEEEAHRTKADYETR